MDINSLKQQIDFLAEKINLINQNIQFNISTFLTVLTIGLAIAGGAAIVIAKYLFDKRFEEETKKLDIKIKNTIAENPPILYFKAGTGTLLSLEDGSDERYFTIHYPINSKISEDLIIMSEFQYRIGTEVHLLHDYTLNVKGDGVTIRVKTPKGFNMYFSGFFIMWRNPVYYKDELKI